MAESKVPPCNACGRGDFLLLTSAHDFDTSQEPFDLCQCQHCGLVRTEPQLSGEALARYYSPSYYGGADSKFTPVIETLTRISNRRLASRVINQLRRSYGSSQNAHYRFLDIGCGRGNLLKSLARRGHDCHGLERKEFVADNPSSAVRYHFGDIMDVGFQESSFDAVVMWHTLEHMENPVCHLEEIRRILNPGGILAIAVPNIDSFQARLFHSDWFHLDLPRHTHHFSLGWLRNYIADHGFRITRTSTLAFDQNAYGFIQSALNRWIASKRKNTLYEILKSPAHAGSLVEKGRWLLLAAMLAPFACVEYAVSGLYGKGATAIIFAEKS